MKTEILTYSGTLEIRRCWCGMRHAIPAELSEALRADRNQVAYCPLGHSYVQGGETEAEKLKKQLGWERDAKQRLQRQVDHKDAQVRGYKGQLTKVKKRAANGICPCCNRTFVNMATHIAKQHPDFVEVANA